MQPILNLYHILCINPVEGVLLERVKASLILLKNVESSLGPDVLELMQ